METTTPNYCIPQVSMMLNALPIAMSQSMALSIQASKYLLIPSLANKKKGQKIKSICQQKQKCMQYQHNQLNHEPYIKLTDFMNSFTDPT